MADRLGVLSKDKLSLSSLRLPLTSLSLSPACCLDGAMRRLPNASMELNVRAAQTGAGCSFLLRIQHLPQVAHVFLHKSMIVFGTRETHAEGVSCWLGN